MKRFNLILCIIASVYMLFSTIASCQSSSKTESTKDIIIDTLSPNNSTNYAIEKEDSAKKEDNIKKDSVMAKAIDLGLSVLWADRNIGASSPECNGDYFSWGETTIKEKYTWLTYKFFIDSDDSGYPWKTNGEEDEDCTPNELSNLGEDIAGTVYDAAYTLWGEDWMMPTRQQWNELIENCRWTITTQNSNKGYKVTSKINGNSIFLPIAGYRCDTTLHAKDAPFYWSSTSEPSSPYHAFGAYFEFFACAPPYTGFWHRYNGLSIRPVKK
ncbi:MAG: hypothetical protein E7081_08635 [Bacteroidales bacterium]|nr:hypothetical protein [Bacteroidales bacterium]